MVFRRFNIEETVYGLISAGSVPSLIIVGIDNGGSTDKTTNPATDRANEFLPYPDVGFAPDRLYQPNPPNPIGKLYPDFVAEVMTLIKQKYRVKSGAENTGIGGFSYGGVAALYTAIKKPDDVGKLLLESTPLWIGEDKQLLKDARQAKKWSPKIYIGLGTKETQDEVVNKEGRAEHDEIIDVIKKNSPQTAIKVVLDEEGKHEASSWSKRFPAALQFLFGKEENLFASAANSKTGDKEAASEIPDRLFAAMKAKNFDEIRAVFTPEGQLVAIDKPRDGKGISKTRVFTAESFAKTISEAKGADFIEKMLNKDVKISGDPGTVSGRYTFYVGEKFSHCGTNTFNLVRTEAGWRIANAASTLEFQCERDLKAVEIQPIEANPQDVSTIDGIIKAFYEVISGGKGVPRQWSRDKTLYTPDVRFVAMSEANGKISANVMNHNQYAGGSNEFFVKEGFTEREINRVVRRFGNIAHVFSVYEFYTEDKKLSGRGINSIELFYDGMRWWISAASWDEERPNNPIPKEFLPKGKR
jgi:predicted alpha/beta superfamily hydrolase